MALRSQFFSGEHVSMDYVRMMADFMGINLDEVQAEIDKKAELRRIAWEQKPDTRWETSKAFHRYSEIMRWQDRQVFYNDWFDRYAVYGLPGGSRDCDTLEQAVSLLYNGN